MCYGCKLGGTPWSSLDYPFSRCHRCHQGRAQISVTPTQYWQFYTSIFQPDILVHTTTAMPWSIWSNVTFWQNVQDLSFSIGMKLFFTIVLFCPVQTDSKFSHGWLSYLSWLDPRDLSKGLWSLEWRVKIVHRKDSDRLPGYFVLRSGCQIVQGAVLTPAPTLILGSSTARVGCAPPLFFCNGSYFAKLLRLEWRGCHSICWICFLYKEDYLKKMFWFKAWA